MRYVVGLTGALTAGFGAGLQGPSTACIVVGVIFVILAVGKYD